MHSCAEDGMARREQMKNGNGIFQAPLAASFIAEPIAWPTSRWSSATAESNPWVWTRKSTTWSSYGAGAIFHTRALRRSIIALPWGVTWAAGRRGA